jgi:hypothetical protein
MARPDADHPAPGAGANQRPNAHLLKVVGEDVAIGLSVFVGETHDRPGRGFARIRHRRPPALQVVRDTLACDLLEQKLRNVAATIISHVDDQTVPVALDGEIAVELGKPGAHHVGYVKVADLAVRPGVNPAAHLSDKEVAAVVAAAWAQPDQDFALLVEVVAQTGCRISQAIRLNVEDPLTGDRLNMPSSFKGRGKATYHKRPIPITPSLWKKLANAAAGRKGDEPLLTDADGTRWYKNCQSSRFPAIAKAAGVKATTYAFRHSSIVRALLLNVPIRLVAANHDTSVAKIEKTYSRFITTPGEALTRRALLDFAPPAADNVPMVR